VILAPDINVMTYLTYLLVCIGTVLFWQTAIVANKYGGGGGGGVGVVC